MLSRHSDCDHVEGVIDTSSVFVTLMILFGWPVGWEDTDGLAGRERVVSRAGRAAIAIDVSLAPRT